MEYTELIICLAGLALLACWLLRTSLGRKALDNSRPRRNDMPYYLPLIPFFFAFGVVPIAAAAAHKLTRDFPDWQSSFVDNIILSAGAALTAGIIIILARAHFARRLKGFGLNLRTLPRDLLAAPLYLLAAWPLIMAAVWLTVNIVQHTSDPEYQIRQHQQLELATKHPEPALLVVIFVAAVSIVPVFEELLFRGLIQSMVRSFFRAGRQVWVAIALSSGLFAIMHEDPGHWPALFVLGACMGYAYEKSGSLWRPIFIHAIFNATSVIATMSK